MRPVRTCEAPPGRPDVLFYLACMDALECTIAGRGSEPIATADAFAPGECRSRALVNLRHAVASGYRQFSRIRDEPALESLRSDGRFRDLLFDAAFPQNVFAPR